MLETKRGPHIKTAIDQLNEAVEECGFVVDAHVCQMIAELNKHYADSSGAYFRYASVKREQQHAFAVLSAAQKFHIVVNRLTEILSPSTQQLEAAIRAAEQEVAPLAAA